MKHADRLDVGGDHQIERVPGIRDVVGVDRRGAASGEITQARVGECGAEPSRRHDPLHVIDEDVAAGGVADDDAVPLRCRHDLRGLGDGHVRRQHERGVPRHGLRLHPSDRRVEILQRHVLRQHTQAAATGEGGREPRTGDGVHVRRHQRERGGSAVVGREVDVEAARHLRSTGDEEDIRIREIDLGLGAVELHGPSVTSRLRGEPPRGFGIVLATFARVANAQPEGTTLDPRACEPLTVRRIPHDLHESGR